MQTHPAHTFMGRFEETNDVHPSTSLPSRPPLA
jgi:hypothetical protein